MPPASLNHRDPTTGDTPASRPASSLVRPAAIAAQNRTSSARHATPGRPGDRSGARSLRSERRPLVVIASSASRALRRPVETAQDPPVRTADQPWSGLLPSDRHVERFERDPGRAGSRAWTRAPSVAPARRDLQDPAHRPDRPDASVLIPQARTSPGGRSEDERGLSRGLSRSIRARSSSRRPPRALRHEVGRQRRPGPRRHGPPHGPHPGLAVAPNPAPKHRLMKPELLGHRDDDHPARADPLHRLALERLGRRPSPPALAPPALLPGPADPPRSTHRAGARSPPPGRGAVHPRFIGTDLLERALTGGQPVRADERRRWSRRQGPPRRGTTRRLPGRMRATRRRRARGARATQPSVEALGRRQRWTKMAEPRLATPSAFQSVSSTRS